MEINSEIILIFLICSFFVGFLKSTFGSGIGIVLFPILALIWPTKLILGIIAVLMWITDYSAASLFWKKWESSLVKIIVPGFYIGIFVGTFFLIQMSDFWLRKSLGVACIIFSFFQIWNERQKKTPKANTDKYSINNLASTLFLGIIGGITSAMFHAGGLILALFFLKKGLKKVPLVATITFTWFWVNPFKVMNFWYHGLVNKEMFLIGILMFPLCYLGGWIGRRVLFVVPQNVFNFCLLFLAILTASKLIIE
ncbi:MAG: sulfite exporter TauE/SafE family protein [Nitrospinota bacterium]|nr:sulfite exporter TauE/SafE family protein [Nitrospinota bacterium]